MASMNRDVYLTRQEIWCGVLSWGFDSPLWHHVFPPESSVPFFKFEKAHSTVSLCRIWLKPMCSLGFNGALQTGDLVRVRTNSWVPHPNVRGSRLPEKFPGRSLSDESSCFPLSGCTTRRCKEDRLLELPNTASSKEQRRCCASLFLVVLVTWIFS